MARPGEAVPDRLARPLGVGRRKRLLLLALLLLGLAGMKLSYNPDLGRNSLDGDFYYQVARNVEEGRGLQTNVSLYHQGIKTFPHKSNVAPLWPLTLGHSGRAVGLYRAARSLPELFFLLDLALLYLLANVLAVRVGRSGFDGLVLPGRTKLLDVGHVAVLVFGLNPVFFEFTSLPYTESMAFALLLSTLLAVDRAASGKLGWAALAGALGAAAFMTRAQMVGVLIAVPMVLVFFGIRHRRLLVSAAVATAAAGAMLLPWALFLRTFIDPLTFQAMVSLAPSGETPGLALFDQSLAVDGLGARLRDRLGGLVLSFDPRSRDSYLESFSWSAMLVPLLGLRLLTLGRGIWSAAGKVFEVRFLLPMATALAAFGALGPIHDFHSVFFKEWLFGFRHGLPLILLIALALATLIDQPGRGWRAAAIGLATLGVVLSAITVGHLMQRKHLPSLLDAEKAFVTWAEAQTSPPTVITTNAQPLSVYSRANFHWMYCREDAEKTRKLLEGGGATYVLFYPGEQRCPFMQGLEEELELVRVFEGRPQVGLLGPR